MRQYIIALNVSLPDNISPKKWLSSKVGSVDLANVKVHIEEVKSEKVSKTSNDSGNRKNRSRVEGSSEEV